MTAVDPALVLAASTEITTAALAGDDPDAVLPLVVRRAGELAEADLGLAMLTGDDGALTVEASSGGDDPVGIVLSDRSSAARAARTGVPVVADDFTTDPRTAPFVPKPLRGYGPFAVAPFGTRERRLGALAVYRRKGAAPFSTDTVDVLTAFAAQAGLAVVLAEGFTARQRVAVYQERERIARDLHDVIIQRLYATGVQLELLDRRLKLDGREAKRLADVVDQLDQTMADVRATVRALRSADPGRPGDADLRKSVLAEAHTAGELLGFDPEVRIDGELRRVPPELADHARAALREALSNVVRHSGARHVEIGVAEDAERLVLRVADDGCGIPRGVARRGLRHLEERALAAGGGCEVASSPRTGTTITWHVPLG
ncbi:histidine kinase/DNA gyrase B/HSP90-like ATPase [Saccharothrix australiensis]|uniref:Histidine kinase/DNA gyrase B/HSP90-like ATPase n=1 Tax=Saccharothrix australiensis TaxID=2072 RepID=A0A495VRC4_9PSEU|nr:GAF domain-containing sensor histidine kinase [Saccharothrix australiensis]RKT51969.1 histidine kinase/DNA gyrase B/HSP90-like ATPase [Saccharothrix australiensis]